MAYSLNAFNSLWEGYTIIFNGTKGRLEHTIVEQSIFAFGERQRRPGAREGLRRLAARAIRCAGPPTTVEPRTGKGSHGGGDVVMLADLFAPSARPPIRCCAPPTSAAARIRILCRHRGRQPLLRHGPDRAHRSISSAAWPPAALPAHAVAHRAGADAGQRCQRPLADPQAARAVPETRYGDFVFFTVMSGGRP